MPGLPRTSRHVVVGLLALTLPLFGACRIPTRAEVASQEAARAATQAAPARGQAAPAAGQGAPAAAPAAPVAATHTDSHTADEVHVIVREWTVEPATLNLPAGRPVTLVLDNRGQLEHDVTIPALNVQLVAAAGKSARKTIQSDRAGEYDLLCSIVGHRELGMHGVARVGDPSEVAARIEQTASTAPATHSHGDLVSTSTRGNQELAYRLEGDTKVFDVVAEAVRW